MTWPTVKLGEICDVRDGTHDSPKFVDEGYPLVTSKNLVNGKVNIENTSKICEADYIQIAKRSGVSTGDILMPMIGTIGNPVIIKDKNPKFAIKNVALIKFTHKSTDNNFIKFVLNSDLFRAYIDNASRGGTQKFLSLGDIRNFSFPIPPLAEQQRIAAILDKAEGIKRKREQAIEKLDQLAQSTFVEMFGNTIENNKNFPVKTLGELIDFQGGSQPPASNFTFEESTDSIRLVQIRDFRTDKFKTYIPKEMCKRFFEEDDVMIGRYGPPVFQIFRGLSGSYNVALMKAVPKLNLTKDFIFYLLQEKYLHNYVVSNSERTAGQSGVNLELLEKYKAYIPPFDLQNRFSQVASSIEKQKKKLIVANEKEINLLGSLQHQAFTTGFNA